MASWVKSLCFAASLLALPVVAQAANAPEVDACLKADAFRKGNESFVLCETALKLPNLDKETTARIFQQQGEAYYWSSRFVDAGLLFDKGLELLPKDVALRNLKGRALRRSGNYEAAFQINSDLFAENPNDGHALYEIGLIYATIGQSDKAFEALQQAVKLQPDKVLIHLALAELYKGDKYNPAAQLQEYDIILSKGREHLRTIRFFNGKNFVDPDLYLDVSLEKAALLARGDRKQESKNLLAQVEKEFPNEFQVGFYLSDIILGENKPKEALGVVSPANVRCLQHFAVMACTEGLTIEMRAQLALKNHSEAAKLADQLVSSAMTYAARADALFWSGVIDKRQGKTKDATAKIKESVQLDGQIQASVMTQLTQNGYYEGDVSEAWSFKADNALEACMVDPQCL
jgi:tetratricopeptide (TPR) repeat protein